MITGLCQRGVDGVEPSHAYTAPYNEVMVELFRPKPAVRKAPGSSQSSAHELRADISKRHGHSLGATAENKPLLEESYLRMLAIAATAAVRLILFITTPG